MRAEATGDTFTEMTSEQRAGVDRRSLRARALRRPCPSRLARSSFSIFIASTTTSGCRACDRVAGLDQDADDLARHRRHDPLRPDRPRRRALRPQRRRPFSVTATGVDADVHDRSCPVAGVERASVDLVRLAPCPMSKRQACARRCARRPPAQAVRRSTPSTPIAGTRDRPTCRVRPPISISYCTSAQPFGARLRSASSRGAARTSSASSRRRRRQQRAWSAAAIAATSSTRRRRLDERPAVARLQHLVEIGRVKPAVEKVGLRRAAT